jgi:CAAX protease family protein
MRMSQPAAPEGRLRAYAQFIGAIIYFLLIAGLARDSAPALVGDRWAPLAQQGILVFLLLLGYTAMGLWLNHQANPISEQGLPRRKGWRGEAALGMATGWGMAAACVLPLALIGGIVVSVSASPSDWGWLAADAAFFALAALGEEIAFRGYGFQRCVEAVGPIWASLGFAFFYAMTQWLLPGADGASFAVAMALGLLLSAAYLRTRALWVSWGINFGWKASRALVFGLTISGVSAHSPVVQGVALGPPWLTGGGYGLDGSWFAFLVLLVALPVVFRLTRELDFRYNAPVIVPAGIPVDMEAAIRAQHEAAMGAGTAMGAGAEAATPLVQIAPVGAAPDASPGELPADLAPRHE